MVASAAACGPTSREPRLDPVDDQVGFVGAELSLTVRASDPDADALSFSFSAPEIPDLSERATIRPYGTDGSTAIFRWTPIARDVGTWLVDLEVTDGGVTITETITIEIKAAVGSNEQPAFVKPLGNSVSLDLAMKKCVDLDIEIEDPDDARVDIAAEPQLIAGSQLDVTGDKTAKWHWCPSAAQIAAQDRYSLNLSADDGQSPKTPKAVLILIAKAPVTGCTGGSPTVTHGSQNVSTLAPVTLAAQITDDVGLKSGPVLYYATTPPATPVNLSTMTPLPARLDSGDMKDGRWVVDVPNPVADGATGATATLYYVWVAVDNDDADGDCDHTTQQPASGTYQATVTNPGGAGNLATCAECTADAQCGGAADHCITVGAGKYCGKGCNGDGDCPLDYQCSAAALTSVNGVMARQCVPRSGSCTAVEPPACTDDAGEQNDSLAAAAGKPPLQVGTNYDLAMCPAPGGGVDEDWYRIVVVSEDAEITVNLTGGAGTDLDLQLLSAGAAPLDVSAATGSTESVSGCLSPGTYYVRVYSTAATPAAASYRLSYTGVNRSCNPSTCTEDELEPNDTFDEALDLLPDIFVKDGENDLAICTGDDDFFRLELEAGDVLRASLTFTQPSAFEGDLDFHFYDGTTDLTPCTEEVPCTRDRGQSADSNEYFERTIAHDGVYYLVVHGYEGAENEYDVCVSLEANQCPKYL